MRSRLARLVVAAAGTAVVFASGATGAGAWSNGPGGDGFGTHDWILYQANRIAVAKGYTWLDWPVAQKATDDPDTKLHDTRNHVYQLGANRYGSSPERVAALYAQMVAELKRGDRKAASYSMGLAAHYLADTGNPLHTDQIPAEERIHSKYERAVEPLAQEGVTPSWLRPTGLDRSVAPRDLTVQAAQRAHRSYAELVAVFSARGYDPRVDAITKASLAGAVGDVESVLVMAGKAAAPPPRAAAAKAAPVAAAPAKQGEVAATGSASGPASAAPAAAQEATGAGDAPAVPAATAQTPPAAGVALATICCGALVIVVATILIVMLVRRGRPRA